MRGSRFITFFLLLFVSFMLYTPAADSAPENTVYVVPLEETVEKGLYAFLNRAIATAEKDGAKAIIFEINTPGGAVDAAGNIGKLFNSTELKTIAYINENALSAGAYIALNADEIYMVPGAKMGAAGIIDQNGNAAGKKAESFWFTAMESAAKQGGRDPIYALAMADPDVDLPELGAEKGKYLTLSSDQALEVGYAEGVVKNLDELLEKLGYENAKVETLDESFAEKVARFITNPIVIPILLTIGSLGLVVELYSPGFGVPGFMGLTALILYFYGHLVAGLAGYETIILFAVGIALLILEIFIPGGIAGLIGVGAIVASLFLASGNMVHLGISLLIAISISILVSILMIRVFGRKMRIFKKIILTDSTSTEEGYISNKSRVDLIGREGEALTALRPSGTVLLSDERIDVVSEGPFIQKGARVKVVKAEGSRIVVREIKELDK